MIKYTNNVDDIVLCWHEAFGDSREDIEFFINNAKNCRCLAYYDNEQICSMLYLVECELLGRQAQYVYAACTLEKFRNKGCMSQLLKYVQAHFGCVCLIPAENWLIEYYKNRGFTHDVSLKSLVFNQSDEIVDYLFDGCSLEQPFALCYVRN